ncbi:MAG TPA: hypothetical protein PKL06_04185 [Chitinophagales bacterium]|jgi:hypothetical protein|nr:hypothetical protein [Chitinophagales bacterium]
MEKDWMMVFQTPDRIEAYYLLSELQQQEIYAVVFEKKANIYIADIQPPEYQIFTHYKQAEEAIDIIDNLTT